MGEDGQGSEAALPEYFVGIGASAGGLDALERLFGTLSAEIPMAFVVAQHLSPDHKSMMVELLTKRTKLAVVEAHDDAPLTGGTIFLVPAHANVIVEKSRLRLSGRAAPHTLNLPIDQLLRSLALSFGDRAIGVILSGTGSDGREGVVAIKNAGGLALVQDPDTATFDGMPREAIRTGLVDAVMPAEEIARELERIGGDRVLLAHLSGSARPNDAFEQLVEEMRRAIGFDLSAYKPGTVVRRIERRLAARGVGSLDEYTALLRKEPGEAAQLLSEILINVTAFFRDAEVFGALESTYLPDLRGHVGSDQLRVWVPGCATGEEAYSLAMLLAEQTGDFKLFGTDVDEGALAMATAATYDVDALSALSPERRERFFVRRDGRFEVDRELRKRVVFAPHNLLADPPFTRMDMVSCRNLLIYLTPDAQRRAIDALSFALKPGGILVLGTSEVLGGRYDEFKTLDAHLKIFVRKDGRRAIQVPVLRAKTIVPTPALSDDEQAVRGALRILTDRIAGAAVLVNEHQRLVHVFGNAGNLLILPVGEPSLELSTLLEEGLRVVTNVAFHRALSTNQELTLATTGPSPVAAVCAIPFATRTQAGRFVLLVFETHAQVTLPAPSEETTHVVALQRELHLARQSLQTAVEELETSNEELQATNEELLASNEELQATNEELQSVNEELHTVNVEHQARITELSETNADLDNLLSATPTATIFLDEKLRIRRFNPPAASLFPLLPGDLGRPLAHFTSALSSSAFTQELAAVVEHATPFEQEVATTSGLRFWLRAVPHVGPQRRVCGVVLTFSNITALHETRESQELLQSVLDALTSNIAVLDDDGVIQFVNAAWDEFAHVNGGARVGIGAPYLDACREVPEIRTAIEGVLAGNRKFFECEYPCHSPTEERWFVMHVHRTQDGRRTVVSHTNVTGTRGRGR